MKRSGDGIIDKEELRAVFEGLGLHVGDAELSAMFLAAEPWLGPGSRADAKGGGGQNKLVSPPTKLKNMPSANKQTNEHARAHTHTSKWVLTNGQDATHMSVFWCKLDFFQKTDVFAWVSACFGMGVGNPF